MRVAALTDVEMDIAVVLDILKLATANALVTDEEPMLEDEP